MLSCCNIGVTVEGMDLFKGLGFSLFPGSILIVEGKNGIGKSSLLKTLATLQPNYSGEILYNDINIQNALEEFRHLLCYTGHKPALFEELSVYDNLALWAQLNNREPSILAAIAVFGLRDYLDEKVVTLSKGWQKKVALTKTLLTNAKIWLLDEPFTNLDKESAERLKDMITAKSQQNGIIIITSHQHVDMSSAARINLGDFAS